MNFKRLDKKDYKKLMEKTNDSGINQNHIILSFLDFDFDPDLISEKLGLKSLSNGQKGDVYFADTQKQTAKTKDCSHWDYELKIKSNDFIGDLIDKFFKEIIIPRIDSIKEIGQNCEAVRFVIVQYYFTGHNPGYGFNKGQIKILADINAEIDIDIYCLSEDE